MIHYRLQCRNEHEFEGWFKDSAAFEQQARLGFLECPVCGDSGVSRALMAPAVRKARTELAPPALPDAAPQPGPTGSPANPAAPARPAHGAAGVPGLPAEVRATLQRLRAEVEKSCDYVGPAFPEVARSIHRGEIEPRGIYGEASSEEAEGLAQEGIQVNRIPWVPRADG